MKNFIELPQEDGNILVNVKAILMVKPSDFKDTPCTEISLSFIGNASIRDIPKDTPPSKVAYSEPLSVHVLLPYAHVLKLIEEAL